MTDEPRQTGSDVTWKQQRDEIAKRNADAHRRGQEERRARDRMFDARGRVQAAREAEELHELNTQIAKRREGGLG